MARHVEPKMVMEARNEKGELLFDVPQPPFYECTENQIARHYFAASGDRSHSVSMGKIADWYHARNWHWRRKTW